jgi:hypothetical protein
VIHRQNVELKNTDGKKSRPIKRRMGQKVEGKALNGKKTPKGQNIE